MKKVINLSAIVTVAILMLPFVAFAQPSGGVLPSTTADSPFLLLLSNILQFINAVLIPFIIGIGFLVFVWGMFQYFIAGGANDEAKEKGKSLMVYATLGFVLIIIFWGVINLVASSTGLGGTVITNVPGAFTF